MDGRHTKDCFATCVAWLTGEDIHVLPSSTFARMIRDTGDFEDETGWPLWLEQNGYAFKIKRDRHYRKLHIAALSVDGSETETHAVVCKGKRIVYNPTDSTGLPQLPLGDLFFSYKLMEREKCGRKSM